MSCQRSAKEATIALALEQLQTLLQGQRAVCALASVLRDQVDNENEEGSWATSYAMERLADEGLETSERLLQSLTDALGQCAAVEA